VPAELVTLVGDDTGPPGAAPGRTPQAAFDGAAAAFQPETAGGEDGRGTDDEHEDYGEEPYGIDCQPFADPQRRI